MTEEDRIIELEQENQRLQNEIALALQGRDNECSHRLRLEDLRDTDTCVAHVLLLENKNEKQKEHIATLESQNAVLMQGIKFATEQMKTNGDMAHIFDTYYKAVTDAQRYEQALSAIIHHALDIDPGLVSQNVIQTAKEALKGKESNDTQ